MKKVHVVFPAILTIFSLLFTSVPVQAATTPVLRPIADGYVNQWKTSSGTTRYVLVDETVCNQTDYIYATSTRTLLLNSFKLNISSVPASSTITGILIQPCAGSYLSGTTTSGFDLYYRYNGVNGIPSLYKVSSTTSTLLATSTWSGLNLPKNASSTLEIVIRNLQSPRGTRLSRVAATIVYSTSTNR